MDTIHSLVKIDDAAQCVSRDHENSDGSTHIAVSPHRIIITLKNMHRLS